MLKYLNKFFYKSEIFIPIIVSIYAYYIFNLSHSNWIMPVEYFTTELIKGNSDRAFIQRLLGPYVIILIQKFSFSLETSYRIFIKLNFLVNALVFYYSMKKLNLNILKSSSYLIIYKFLICSYFGSLFYPWDFIDLWIYVILLYLILKKKNIFSFVMLFFFSMLNGERALIIPVYIVINSITLIKKKISINLNNFFLGLILLILGIIYLYVIRIYLSPIKPGTTETIFGGNGFHLLRNIEHFLFINWFSHNFFYQITFVALTVYFISSIYKFKKFQINIFLIYLIKFSLVFTFGIIEEVRDFLFIIPTALILFITINEKNIKYN
jgi:hypothetical protein